MGSRDSESLNTFSLSPNSRPFSSTVDAYSRELWDPPNPPNDSCWICRSRSFRIVEREREGGRGRRERGGRRDREGGKEGIKGRKEGRRERGGRGEMGEAQEGKEGKEKRGERCKRCYTQGLHRIFG